MQARNPKTFDAGKRVEGFLDAESAAIGDAISPSLRAKLDAAVAKLGQFQLDQGSADRNAQGATTEEDAMREEVYDRFLGPIAEIARTALKGTAEYENLTTLSTTKKTNTFVTRATEVANAAEKHADLLIANGMAPDFIAQLRAAIAVVEQARSSRGSLVTQRSKATAGLDEADKDVRDAIRLIDRQLRAVLKKNAPLAGAWKTAKKIAALPVTPLPTGTPVEPTTVSDTKPAPTLVPPAKAA